MSKEESNALETVVVAYSVDPNRVNCSMLFDNFQPPTFWPEKPALWFISLESHFSIHGVTDDNVKYNYVLSVLVKKYITAISDTVINPPESDKYEKLKSEVIKHVTALREKETRLQLLQEEMGDRSPSEHLQHLQQLGGGDVTDDVMCLIWISHMPNKVKSILCSEYQSESDLQILASIADILHYIELKQVAVAKKSALEEMTKQVAELTRQVQALTVKSERRSRSRGSYRVSTTRSQSAYRKHPVCYYHFKYGDQAGKCIKPCDY